MSTVIGAQSPGSAEAIARNTTDPRYLSEWVASVPDSATVPSPSDVLSHIAGQAGELPNSDQIYGYYRRLAAASDRVSLETLGHTEEGREILLVATAAAAGPTLGARLGLPGRARRRGVTVGPFGSGGGQVHGETSQQVQVLADLARVVGSDQ